MSRVYLGLGSNVEAEKNLRNAVSELRCRYGEIRLSRVYRNAALGFEGDEFLNLVVGFESDESPAGILGDIAAIHAIAGRIRGPDRFRSRTLDIDLLLYGGLVDPGLRVPRPDILSYSFVLRPLAELAPREVHPQTGRTYAAHWQEFDANSHPLTPVDVIL